MRALAMLLLSAALLAGQSASISGRVVNLATGSPVSGVELRLGLGRSGSMPAATSDAQGGFRFEHLAPGAYTLHATKPGFVSMTYGAAALGNPGRTLAVTSDDGIAGLELRLIPLGAIEGKVIDPDGGPVKGVTIACGFVNAYGAPPTMEALPVVTDERGEYRLAGMPPGVYYVQALPAARLLPAFYPSAGRFGEAQPVVLAAGQEASGIKISLRDAPVFHVLGKVAGAVDGVAAGDLKLLALPKNESDGPLFGAQYVQALTRRIGGADRVARDGSFELNGLERGSYEVMAVSKRRESELLGRVTIQVTDRDLTDVVLPAGEFARVSFRFLGDPQADAVTCSLNAHPLEGDLAWATLAGVTDAHGVFAYERAMPGTYALRARCPQGWIVKSARLEGETGGQDVADGGLRLASGRGVVDVVLTRDTGVVVVNVKEGETAAAGRWVTLIPYPVSPGGALHEASGWSDEEGRLIVKSAAPGEYRVYAWREAALAMSSESPEFLKRFERQSVKVTVRAGEQAKAETKTVEPQ